MSGETDEPAVAFVPITDEALEAMRLISDDTRQTAGRISEKDFVEKLLPVLTNPAGRVDISIWQNYAGHMLRPLDVVGPGNQILFRCPAPLRTIETASPEDRRERLGEIVAYTKAKTEQHPRLGEAYLQEHLGRKDIHLQDEGNRIAEWNKILIRYGYTPVEVDGAPKEEDILPAATAAAEVKPVLSDEDEPL